MMVSRAASDVISPMPIFQLKPSGLMTGSMVRPIVPARLCSMPAACRRCTAGSVSDPEDHGHQQNHGAGALQEDFGAVQQAQSQRLQRGPAVGRHLQQERRLRALQNARFQQARRHHRRQEAEQIQAQQRRHLRGDQDCPSKLRFGMKAAISSA